MIGIVTTSFNRTLTSGIGRLRDTMNARFKAVDAKFETLNVKLEDMDRDIQSAHPAHLRWGIPLGGSRVALQLTEVESPVVAAQYVTGWVLEVAL